MSPSHLYHTFLYALVFKPIQLGLDLVKGGPFLHGEQLRLVVPARVHFTRERELHGRLLDGFRHTRVAEESCTDSAATRRQMRRIKRAGESGRSR
jgi:hypothetical protein